MANSMLSAEEILRGGDPAEALRRLTVEVKAKPADARLRVFMAQLLCVVGKWERALNQLDVVAEMDAKAIPMRETYGTAIRCEALRGEVFRGAKTPLVFGQPEEWLALLLEALRRGAGGNAAAGADLVARALEAAPATAGQIDGVPFTWIADADTRLGPVLEAYVKGHYYWIPFSRLARVVVEPPADLRDCIWMPAHLWFSNGGEEIALIPTRYPGSEDSDDGLVQLARKTVWAEAGAGQWTGLGQRLFTTDQGDRALMDTREIVLETA